MVDFTGDDECNKLRRRAYTVTSCTFVKARLLCNHRKYADRRLLAVTTLRSIQQTSYSIDASGLQLSVNMFALLQISLIQIIGLVEQVYAKTQSV